MSPRSQDAPPSWVRQTAALASGTKLRRHQVDALAGGDDQVLQVLEAAGWKLEGSTGAAALLRRNLLVYGIGGIIIPFIGIKLIDIVITSIGLA